MPQRILCRECSAVLYEGFELESPLDVIAGKDGFCPECGRKLEFTPDAIRITPVSQ